MGISGALTTMSLPDILQWLSMGIKTGILEFSGSDGNTKKIYFRDGTIISAKSSDIRDSLGQILIRNKKITKSQLDSLLSLQKSSGAILGKILLSESILTDEELMYYLRLQSEEIIFSLFKWTDAAFEFTECPIPDNEIIPISLRVVSLIMEGTKRQDDWSRILKALPNANMILDFSEEGRLNILMRSMSAEEKRLLDRIDGTKSLGELCSISGLSDYETYSFLYGLLSENILELRGIKDEHAEQKKIIERELVKIRDLLEIGNLIQAKELFEKLSVQYPDDPGTKLIGERLRNQIDSDIARMIPNEEVIPRPAYNNDLSALTKLNITPEEGFLLSRIDGTMSVKEIRHISGFSKRDIHFALYRLKVLNVIDLPLKQEPKTGQGPAPKQDSMRIELTDSAKFVVSDFKQEQQTQYEKKASAQSKLPPEMQEMIEKKYKKAMIGSYYDILEVDPSVSADDIKKQFYALSKQFHPDKFMADATTTQVGKLEKIFNQITRAFEMLINADDREAYDRSLGINRSELMPEEQPGEIDTDKGRHFFKLGQHSFKMKEFDTAYDYFRQACQANPDNPVYLGMLAQLEYRHVRNLDAAEKNCRKAISLEKTNPKLFIILGKILVEKERTDEARQAFESALALDRQNAIARQELRKLH